MGICNRKLALAISIIASVAFFSLDMVAFHEYRQRGTYRYENHNDSHFHIVKDNYTYEACYNQTEAIELFNDNELNWLVYRTGSHYFFLACFWIGVLVALVLDVSGTKFE